MEKVDELILKEALKTAILWLDNKIKAHINIESEYNKLMNDNTYDDDYKQKVQLIRLALNK